MNLNSENDTDKSLPIGWIRIKAGDVFALNYGKGLTEAHRDNKGNILVFGSNGIVGKHSKALTNKPSIIVGRKGAAGAVTLALEPCWPIDTTYFVYPPEGISLNFSFYLLSYLNLSSLDRSTAIPGLNRDDFYNQPMLLPPSEEQRRIVEKIEELFTQLDAGVEALKRAQTRLKRYRASLLQAACEGRLVPTEAELARRENRAYEPAAALLARVLTERRRRWEEQEWHKLVEKAQQKAALACRKARGLPARAADLSEAEWRAVPEAEYAPYLPKNDQWKRKYAEPAAPDTAELPDLPEGWVWANIDQLAETVGGVTKGKNLTGKKTIFLPYLRVANVQRGYLDLDVIKEIEVLESDLEKYRLENGDLLLTEGGDADKLGRSSIWNSQISNCIHQNHIFRARPYLSDLDSKWLMYYTNSEAGKKYFLDSSKQTTNLASINLTQLRSCPIPLPPASEISRIITDIDMRNSVLEEMEESINIGLLRAERLRQAILKRAFEGKLVPQDPTDEPAGALLARIKAKNPMNI